MKKILATAIVLLVVAGSVFATRIGITYNGTDYILNTSKAITNDNIGYFNGMYDAFACVTEGKKLHEIHDIIRTKSFPDAKDQSAVMQEYREAFMDFMTNYTYGTDGAFKDIYPIYETAFNATTSYSNAQKIVRYGDAEFFKTNI